MAGTKRPVPPETEAPSEAPKFVATIGGAEIPPLDATPRRPTPLHRSRLFNWQPSSVAAISACPGGSFLAVAYETGDIELWDMNSTTCIQSITGDSMEVTALSWAKDTLDGSWRTFCSHLDGTISEAEWKTSSISSKPLDSAGGVVWALSSQPVDKIKPGFPHLLAAACDDGSVRLFGVEGGEPGLQLERVLTVLQGRLLSCVWHPSGEALAMGGVNGTIHVLDSTSGHELVRITAGSSNLKRNPSLPQSIASSSGPCVWKLLWLEDGTLVSGDSDGAVQFWDGAFGTLLHRFQRHKADILALAASREGDLVFGSGVDPQVALFSLANASDNHPGREPSSSSAAAAAISSSPAAGGWRYLDCKRPHAHDVKAMDVVALQGGRSLLVSGGIDAQLVAYPVSTFLKEHPVRLSRAPQCPASSLALPLCSPPPSTTANSSHEAARSGLQANVGGSHPPPALLLCAHNQTLDVWMLGVHQPLPSPLLSTTGNKRDGHHHRTPQSAMEEGTSLDLVTGPRRLVQIKLDGGARVACSAISPGGRFVACCTARGPVRLYRLTSSSSSDAILVSRVTLGKAQGNGEGAGSMISTLARENRSRALALALSHSHLFAAHPDGTISCYQLPPDDAAIGGDNKDDDSDEAALVAHAPLSAAHLESGTTLLGVRRASLLTPSSLSHTSSSSSFSSAGIWKRYQAPISSLAVSQDGNVLAAAGTHGVQLYRIPLPSPSSMPLSASASGSAVTKTLPRLGKPLKLAHDSQVASLSSKCGGSGGMSFSCDGRLLAIALASGHVSIYDVSSLSHPLQPLLSAASDETTLIAKPLQWSLDNDAAIAKCLEKLPGGTIMGCSFHSHEPRLVVFSPGGFCHFDLRHPIDPSLLEAGGKRRRSKSMPSNPLLHHAIGHSSGAIEKGASGGGAGTGAGAADMGGSRGRNGRAVLLPDPCVFASFVPFDSEGQRRDEGALLVLEKPWEDVMRTFAAPLLRNRYGG